MAKLPDSAYDSFPELLAAVVHERAHRGHPMTPAWIGVLDTLVGAHHVAKILEPLHGKSDVVDSVERATTASTTLGTGTGGVLGAIGEGLAAGFSAVSSAC